MQKYYRFIHSNETVRKNSSSGGAFTLISDLIFEKGGIVYGCAMDDNLNVKHIRAVDKETRNNMRGSKYITSDLKGIFSQINNDLSAGNIVLFTGTPCQCYAITKYLNRLKTNTDNLWRMEVICHGVGSKTFFNDYIKFLESKYKSKAVKVNFRAKYHKGQKQDMEVLFNNGRKYHASSTKYDWFYSVYLQNLILRPSCYECPFAKNERYSDLSVADHWGFRDDEAYSLIVSNTEKCEQLNLVSIEGIEEITKSEVTQPNMRHPSDRPKCREEFWDTYVKYGYLKVQRWIGNNTPKGWLENLLAKVAYDMHIAGLLKHIRRYIYKKQNKEE